MSVLEMKVPSPGESITEVEIANWLVEDGDYVEKDQPIAEVDSDKATLELPAEESGIITLKAEEGDAVAVGEVVCLIDTSASKPEGDASNNEEKNATKEAPTQEHKVAPSVEKKETYASGGGEHKIALIDFGVKRNIIRCLTDRGCEVKVFPMTSTIDEILAYEPNGIMLSNGPGDPSAMPESVALILKLQTHKIPTFGICLGHQLLAQANGLSTFKMHNGHRGINHPVKNLASGKCEITSQNHGFVVNLEEAEQRQDITVTHIHLNDDTLAGIKLNNYPSFSIQYHPESSAGPHDSRYLFDDFITLVNSHKTQLA